MRSLSTLTYDKTLEMWYTQHILKEKDTLCSTQKYTQDHGKINLEILNFE